jgi:hypothetical protein
MPDPRQLHHRSTHVLSIAMVVIGAALVLRTLTSGGGVLAVGVLLGVCFAAAGGARLYLQARDGRGR